jgi:O-6-methylguanine DNA methyltransferase
MRCETVVKKLDAFRTRELEERQRRVMADHMATCRWCADELTAVGALADRCGSLRVRAPGSLMDSVLARAGDRYGAVETELGRAWVGFNERGITLVRLGTKDATAFERAYERRLGRRAQATEVPARYARAVERAAAGAGAANVPIDLASLPAFEREVLQTLPRIPRGEVRPYGWIAKEVGRPRASRAVGNALAKNPVPFLLPCHRVVPSGGGVGNYLSGMAVKRALLEREEVPLDELDRLGTGGVRYLGCKTTRIYCFPTCHDIRRTRPENQVPFASEKVAAAAGYEPCKRCRPVARAA